MYVVKYNVKYDKIGGKVFYKEKEVTKEEVEFEASNCNFACINFISRRKDFTDEFENFNKKLYYGKIIKNRVYLGYVVCEDELWEV